MLWVQRGGGSGKGDLTEQAGTKSIKSRRAKATGPRVQAKAGSGQHAERAGLPGGLLQRTFLGCHCKEGATGARVHGQWAGPSTRSSDRSHVMLALFQEQPRAGNQTSQLFAMHARSQSPPKAPAALTPMPLPDSQTPRDSVAAYLQAPCDATVKQQLRQRQPLYHPVDSSYPIAGGAALRSLSSSTYSPKVAQSDPAARGA